MTSRQKALEPAAEGVVLCEEMWQRRPGTMDQERAQISISSLGDAEQLRPAAGAGLAGHEAEKGGEIGNANVKLPPLIAQLLDQSAHAGAQACRFVRSNIGEGGGEPRRPLSD